MSVQFKNTFSSGIVPVLVENTTDEDFPAYSVIAIGESANREAGEVDREGEDGAVGRFKFPARKPDADAIATGSTSQFLIVLDLPIKAGKTGYATPSVPTFVRVDGEVKERGQPVGPSPDSFEMRNRAGFYSVVDIKEMGDTKFALVDLYGSHSTIEFKAPAEGIAAAPESRDGSDKCEYPSAMCKAYLVTEREGGVVESEPYMVDGSQLELRVANRSSATEITGNSMIGASLFLGGALVVTYYECD